MIQNQNTQCLGNCTRVMVEKTNTVMQCIHICLERDLCRHYVWYKQEKTCWVVEGKGSVVYRVKSRDTITGWCRRGDTGIQFLAATSSSRSDDVTLRA